MPRHEGKIEEGVDRGKEMHLHRDQWDPPPGGCHLRLLDLSQPHGQWGWALCYRQPAPHVPPLRLQVRSCPFWVGPWEVSETCTAWALCWLAVAPPIRVPHHPHLSRHKASLLWPHWCCSVCSDRADTEGFNVHCTHIYSNKKII